MIIHLDYKLDDYDEEHNHTLCGIQLTEQGDHNDTWRTEDNNLSIYTSIEDRKPPKISSGTYCKACIGIFYLKKLK